MSALVMECVRKVFDAGGGQYIAGADTHSDNMASSSVSTRLAGETTLSSAVKLQNYTAIRNLNFMLCNLDNCVEKGSADYNQYVGEAYYFRAWYYYQMFISYGRLTWVNTPLDPNMEEMKFEELTELKEPERLLESAMPFQKLIMQYQCALLEVKTKI